MRWVWSPVGILVIGALLRIAFLLTKRGQQPAFGDTAEYEAIAMQMLGLGDGGSAPRAPAFPALMALGFKLGGTHNYSAVRWLQMPIAILLIEMVRHIGERVGGRNLGLLAALGTAIAPTLVFTSSMLYPTALYTLCVAGVTLAALELDAKPRASMALQLGLWCALGLLTDTVIIAPIGALALWFLWRHRRDLPAVFRVGSVLLATVLVVLLPIRMLGRSASDRPAVFIAKGQSVLHYARTDSTVGADRWIELPADEIATPLPLGRFIGHELHLLREQPVAYVHDVGLEFAHFFAPLPDRIQTRNQYNQPWILWVGALYFAPVLLFSIIGFWRSRAEWSNRIALAAVVLATGVFYAFFFSQTRYRIPVEPEILVLAALGVMTFVKSEQARVP